MTATVFLPVVLVASIVHPRAGNASIAVPPVQAHVSETGMAVRVLDPEVLGALQTFVHENVSGSGFPGVSEISQFDLTAWEGLWTAPDMEWAQSIEPPLTQDEATTDRFVIGAADETVVLDISLVEDRARMVLHFSTRGLMAAAEVVPVEGNEAVAIFTDKDGTLISTQLVDGTSSRAHCGVESTVACGTLFSVRTILLGLVCGGGPIDPLPIEEILCSATRGSSVFTSAACWLNKLLCLSTPIPGLWEEVEVDCPHTDLCTFEGTYVVADAAGTPHGDVWWRGHMTPEAMLEYHRATGDTVTEISFGDQGMVGAVERKWSAWTFWWHSDVRCAFTVTATYQANGSVGVEHVDKPAGSSYCFPT